MMRNVLAAVLVSVPIAAMAGVEQVSNRTAHSYTGCLEAGAAPGTFTLTAIGPGDGSDKNVHGPSNADQPPATSLNVGSTKIGLTSYIGQRVTVTGAASDSGLRRMPKGARESAPQAPVFLVKSLKMVATSCW